MPWGHMVVVQGLVQNRQVGCLVGRMHQKWRVVVGMHTVEQMTVVGVGENCLRMMVAVNHGSSKNPA